MLRTLLYIVLFYIFYKLFREVFSVLGSSRKRSSVHTKRSSESKKLRVDKSDIMDADFKDIDQDEKNKKGSG